MVRKIEGSKEGKGGGVEREGGGMTQQKRGEAGRRGEVLLLKIEEP